MRGSPAASFRDETTIRPSGEMLHGTLTRSDAWSNCSGWEPPTARV